MAIIDRFLAVWRFMTVVPVPGTRGTSTESLREGLWYFPAVGTCISLVPILVGWVLLHGAAGFGWTLPFVHAVGAVVLTASLVLITGGLHLDGLADTFDGLASARGRERALEIMRDSRIGAHGATALVLVLAGKIAALASMPTGAWPAALALAVTGGRCAVLAQIVWLPYVREQGLGTVWAGYRGKWLPGAWAAGFWLAGAVLFDGWRIGLARTAVAALGVLLTGMWYRRRLGGATGDTYGATSEMIETLVLMTFAAVPGK